MFLSTPPLDLPDADRAHRRALRLAAIADADKREHAPAGRSGDYSGGQPYPTDPNKGAAWAWDLARWHVLAGDANAFDRDPVDEQSYAALVCYCAARAAVGRFIGSRAKAGSTVAVDALERGENEPSGLQLPRPHRREDLETAADAISEAWIYRQTHDSEAPFAALAGAIARFAGERRAQHRRWRSIVPADAETFVARTDDERAADAAAELATLRQRMTPEERDSFERALYYWRGQPDDRLTWTPIRSDNALRTMRKIAKRATARSR